VAGVRFIAVLPVIVLVALAACGGNGNGGDIELTDADSGGSVEASVGDEITISLAGNPTTGYTWNVLQPQNADVVAFDDRDYEAESDAIGAGGTEELTFEAVAAGEATIELGYFRPWEPDQVDRTFTVAVTVS
jgi:inhibitor of cysteine peptidase